MGENRIGLLSKSLVSIWLPEILNLASWAFQDLATLCSVKPCPHGTIKPVSPVFRMGSMRPHYTQFHPNGFHLVSPETFRMVGFKRLRFIEHICGFIADVRY